MTLARGLLLVTLACAVVWLGFETLRPDRGARRTLGPLGVDARVPLSRAPVPRVPLRSAPAPPASPPTGVPEREPDTRPFEWNEAALESLERGEIEQAVGLLERCRSLAPDQAVFTHNLAEALTRLARERHESEDPQDRERSLADLRRAVELAPEREELGRLLERWETSSAAEKDLWRKKTLHFELSFDGTRDELMWGTGPLESELESSYAEFGELFGFHPVESGRPRLRVVLLRRDEFAAVTGIGDWAAGAFDGTVRVPVEDLQSERERLKRVLRHELVHAFVLEAGGPSVPGWLNEGLAQWLEAPFEGERPADVQRARARLAGAELFELERLAGTLSRWESVEQIELAYAQSLAFVDWLRRMYGERVVFDMVAGCKQGRAPAETFREGLGGLELALVMGDFADGL